MNFEEELKERWNAEKEKLENPDYYAVVKAGLAVVDNVEGVEVVKEDFNPLSPNSCNYTFTFAPACFGYTKKECKPLLYQIRFVLAKQPPFNKYTVCGFSSAKMTYIKSMKTWQCSFLIKGIE